MEAGLLLLRHSEYDLTGLYNKGKFNENFRAVLRASSDEDLRADALHCIALNFLLLSNDIRYTDNDVILKSMSRKERNKGIN